MSVVAVAFLTYLLHYVGARLIYDDLIRPLTHGQFSTLLLLAVAVGAGLAVRRRRRRRR